MGECIQVVVRCRPFNKKEKDENRTGIIDIDVKGRQVAIKNPDNLEEQPKSFTFDGAFDEFTQQRNFYDDCCFGLVDNVLDGFNGTIFAYGQTGCGKSWTMQGPSSPPELKGVIPNSFTHIFDKIKATKDLEFLVRCSYLEIYNEEIKDLLGDPKNKVKCDIKEDPQKGITVKGLSEIVVETEEQLQGQLDRGLSFRTVAATLMNSESSRSHSIFSIVIEMSSKDELGKEHIKVGKLNLVDLAGSERQKKTGASGALLKEGAKINLSLSALGNVISALSEGKGKFIPYRDSKLTRLLQDSLGGNTKTLMVAAVSPADYNFDETMSTLRYANRAKNIQNKPKVNEDPKDALMRQMKEEIELLKKLLLEHRSGGLQAAVASMSSHGHSIKGGADGHEVVVQHEVSCGSDNGSHYSESHVSTKTILAQQQQQASTQSHSTPHQAKPLATSYEDSDTQASGYTVDQFGQAGGDGEDEGDGAFDFASLVESTTSRLTPRVPPGVAAATSSTGVSPRATAAITSASAAADAKEDPAVIEMRERAQRKAEAKAKANAAEAAATGTGGAAGADAKQASPRVKEVIKEVEVVKEVVKEVVVVEKEVVHVEVEKIPEHHLNEHLALREFSQAVQQERDIAHEALQQTREEVERERQLREDLNLRLQELQNKLHLGNSEAKGAVAAPSEAEEAERAAAEKAYKERKLRARKIRDAKQQEEMQRVLNEKQIMEDELEELRKSAASWAPGGGGAVDESLLDKKIGRLRKKYEKKMAAMKADADDLQEEFYFQRQQLNDALREQEKDTKLFEQICRALLSEKDFRRMVEKARWNEEEEEWILPYAKRKSLDPANFNAQQVGNSRFLPDIAANGLPPKLLGVGSSAGSNHDGAYAPVVHSARGGDNKGYTSARGAVSGSSDPIVGHMPYSARMDSRGTEGYGVAYGGYSGAYGAGGGSSGGGSGTGAYYGQSVGTGSSGAPVPSLMLPGGPSAANEGGIAAAPKEKKKKKKRKPKLEKASDEAGGGQPAGALSDWGFAFGEEDNYEPEYSDDEDFVITDGDPYSSGGNNGTVDKYSNGGGGGSGGFNDAVPLSSRARPPLVTIGGQEVQQLPRPKSQAKSKSKVSGGGGVLLPSVSKQSPRGLLPSL